MRRMVVAAVVGGTLLAGCGASGTSPENPGRDGTRFQYAGKQIAYQPAFPLPQEGQTYAAWNNDVLVAGAYGSSSCYPVPERVNLPANQHVSITFLNPARVEDGEWAVALPADTVCTMDLTVKSYAFPDLPLQRSDPVTVTITIANPSQSPITEEHIVQP